MAVDLNKAKELATQFGLHYYQMFDKNRAGLSNLYVECSLLQFEGEMHMGKEAIMRKLLSIPAVQHIITTSDGQPTVDGAIMVHVLGQMKKDAGVPYTFVESFNLKNAANGAIVILNDTFRTAPKS